MKLKATLDLGRVQVRRISIKHLDLFQDNSRNWQPLQVVEQVFNTKAATQTSHLTKIE